MCALKSFCSTGPNTHKSESPDNTLMFNTEAHTIQEWYCLYGETHCLFWSTVPPTRNYANWQKTMFSVWGLSKSQECWAAVVTTCTLTMQVHCKACCQRAGRTYYTQAISGVWVCKHPLLLMTDNSMMIADMQAVITLTSHAGLNMDPNTKLRSVWHLHAICMSEVKPL